MNNSALLALLESSPWREREKDIEGAGPTNGSIASITPNLQPSGETVDGAGEPFKAMGRNECGATDSALMIHVTQLNEGVVRRIVAIAREMGAVATVIAYQSAKHAAIQHAKRQDIQLVPTPDDGIAWASTLLDFVRMAHEWRHRAKVAQVREKRRFDDAQIASIAQMPTKIACECPKHVAELIRQLTAFERYSDDCQSRTPTDALLHRRLGDVANRATSIFEAALADVIEHEGWN